LLYENTTLLQCISGIFKDFARTYGERGLHIRGNPPKVRKWG